MFKQVLKNFDIYNKDIFEAILESKNYLHLLVDARMQKADN